MLSLNLYSQSTSTKMPDALTPMSGHEAHEKPASQNVGLLSRRGKKRIGGGDVIECAINQLLISSVDLLLALITFEAIGDDQRGRLWCQSGLDLLTPAEQFASL